MKSFIYCIPKIVADTFKNKTERDCFSVLSPSFCDSGIILYRHETKHGILFLVRLNSQFTSLTIHGIWISDCGNSGLLIVGPHTSTRGEFQKEDPDYAEAMKAYRNYMRPFDDADFLEEHFVPLGELLYQDLLQTGEI